MFFTYKYLIFYAKIKLEIIAVETINLRFVSVNYTKCIRIFLASNIYSPR